MQFHLINILLLRYDDIERFEKMIDDLNDKPFNMVVFGGDLFEDSIFDGENVSRILKKIEY